MSDWTLVSEDTTNRNQSWEYAAVLFTEGAKVRVHVRDNAYEHQSHATLSVWGRDGWTFHTSIPTEEWYSQAPSYAKRQLDDDDMCVFWNLRDELLARTAYALFGRNEYVTLTIGQLVN